MFILTWILSSFQDPLFLAKSNEHVMRSILIRMWLAIHVLSSKVGWLNRHSWWRHQMETFSALLALCAGNSPAPVNSPHKGQWRGALMFSLICVWINGWVNNGEAGDLRRYRAHYDVTVMEVRTWVCYCILLFHVDAITYPYILISLLIELIYIVKLLFGLF